MSLVHLRQTILFTLNNSIFFEQFAIIISEQYRTVIYHSKLNYPQNYNEQLLSCSPLLLLLYVSQRILDIVNSKSNSLAFTTSLPEFLYGDTLVCTNQIIENTQACQRFHRGVESITCDQFSNFPKIADLNFMTDPFFCSNMSERVCTAKRE